jgi:hypothetical protein
MGTGPATTVTSDQGRATVLAWQRTVDAAWQRQTDLLPAQPPTPEPPPDPLTRLGTEIAKALARKRGFTVPSRDPDPNAVPRGRPTDLIDNPQGTREIAENNRGLRRENESALALARKGFDIEQNPPPKPNGKMPDYLIEGRYFDNVAPGGDSISTAMSRMRKKVFQEQADRIVLNVSDWTGDLAALQNELWTNPIRDKDNPEWKLQEVIVVNEHGTAVTIYP